jgi:protein-tyrosine-phosphatase
VSEPLRVLFVCTANICRSPFMELLARDLTPDGAADYSSAGTRGFVDAPVWEEIAAELAARQIDHDGFRSRPLTADHVDQADLVLTAEASHRRFILDDQPGAFRRVFTLGQFVGAVRADDSGATGPELLARLGARRGLADPSLDVPDPYRRGPEIAAQCAATIEGMLRVVVPALTGSRMIAP